MKVEVRITVGDKIIGDSFGEPDEVFRLRNFPRQTIDSIHHAMLIKMGESIDKAITELWSRGMVLEPTSYPPRPTGRPYDVVGDIS
jgi:hypothetical protein